VSFVAAGAVVAWLGPRGTYVFGGLVGLLSVLALRPVLAAPRESDAGSFASPGDEVVADPT
jgi:hypothetical protein